MRECEGGGRVRECDEGGRVRECGSGSEGSKGEGEERGERVRENGSKCEVKRGLRSYLKTMTSSLEPSARQSGSRLQITQSLE